MTTTIKLKAMLHRKVAEICAPCPVAAGIGSVFNGDFLNINPASMKAFLAVSGTVIWGYSAKEDSWMQLPLTGLAGTAALTGSGLYARALSAPGGVQLLSATAGTTTTITTTLNLIKALDGVKIEVVAGAGIGYVGTIKTNTMGANAVITVASASTVAFDSTTKFRIYAGALWFVNASNSIANMAVYDPCTNARTARASMTVALTTECNLIGTQSAESPSGTGFVAAAATSATTTTLVDSAKTWPLNGWANAQVRIVSGTGLGQIRTIASNTANTLTVGTAWTVAPDATSNYRIEGNDDVLYIVGSGVATYKYTISTNAWATLVPTTARAAAAGAGHMAAWASSVTTSTFTDGAYTASASGLVRQNGRYIYSFRGLGGNVLDVYDIALNTWVNAVPYGSQMETFTTGSGCTSNGAAMILMKEGTNRLYRFAFGEHDLDALTTIPMPQGTVVAGQKLAIARYADGTTTLDYLLALPHSRSELVRMALF